MEGRDSPEKRSTSLASRPFVRLAAALSELLQPSSLALWRFRYVLAMSKDAVELGMLLAPARILLEVDELRRTIVRTKRRAIGRFDTGFANTQSLQVPEKSLRRHRFKLSRRIRANAAHRPTLDQEDLLHKEPVR